MHLLSRCKTAAVVVNLDKNTSILKLSLNKFGKEVVQDGTVGTARLANERGRSQPAIIRAYTCYEVFLEYGFAGIRICRVALVTSNSIEVFKFHI